ncbi:hypothetical protein Scep_003156 [Stephania cephalantha]|uniref:Mediator complex subunit 15 KIX domain-containing protein n=1 Tax=Stephania cephalantha TaxID=152367 RepID=A0AAP0KPZ2_9MAGN
MDNWRPTAQAEPGMDGGDWRNQLQPDSRAKIVNKIMETLKKHLPITGPEGLVELQKIAIRFEEKIYTAATNQSDYLRKISLKMLTMETKSQGTNGPNSLQPSSAIGNQNPSDSGALGMQAQVLNQGQQIHLPNQSQQRQQMLPQNPIASAGIQSSGGLPSALSSVNGLSQTSVSNAVGQSSGLQNISGIPQNSVGNSVGQGVPSNIFNSAQRPMPGRQHQQQVAPQQNQQQPSTASQYVYQQQQLQQQMLKQKLQQQGNMSQSAMQSHIQQQQQNLLQPSQLQSSQQSLMQMTSNLHSTQPSIQQTQPSMMQSNARPGLQQNQQSSQPSSSSIPQQHPQSILRQQQQSQQSLHQQTAVLHQQQTPMPQTLMGQQPNATNMQQNHLISQQNNVSDMQQQQRLLSQQNNMSNMQQHQQQQLLGHQNNVPNLHQQQLGPQNTVPGMQQQQPLVGTQPGVSSMQPHQSSMHILQQGKVVGQQQSAQASTTLLQVQGQQSQSQSQSQPLQQQQQQQLMSQLQSQPQMGLQQQQNQLQRDSTLQPQGVIEQKPFQPQRAVPDASSTSMDSTGQTGNANSMDWQEEIYQKVKNMKELYLPELNEMHQKISLKFQQHESASQAARDQMDKFKIMDQIEKLKMMKVMLERSMAFLQVSKNNMPHSYREKLGQYEKQILSFVNMNRPKRTLQQGQQQIHPLSGHPLSLQQQQQQQQQQLQQQQQQQLQQQQPQQQQLPSQTSQLQHHDNQMNSQMQPSSLQSGVASMQPTSVTSMQSSMPPLPTQTGISTAQANIMNALQTGSTLESGQGSGPNSLQQTGVGSLQQNSANAPQQANISTNTLSQGVGNASLQSNINSLPLNPNVLQHQHLRQKQEQHMLQTQQLKQQFHQQQMQQQLFQQQKQQILQQQQQQQHPQLQQQFQQQLPQQQKQQQTTQLQSHSMPQLHQMNEDLKMRQGMSFKPGMSQQHHSAGQRASYHHQSLKSGTQFPISPQLAQAASPQISQHASPQIDQQNLLTPFSKAGTPLQSTNSPFIVASPPTPLAPSPMPGDSEKQASGVTLIPNAGNGGQPQATSALAQAQSLAIGTPGISASPLLAEFTSPDGNQGTASAIISGKPNLTEQPMERLIKAVKSMSPKALTAAVSDIGAVISMIDRIAGSAPGNGSRAAVGEDLVAMTKCRIQARNLMTQDGNSGNKKMRRDTSAMPLNVVSSCGSANDSFKQLNALETSDVESTATSGMKRPRFEVNHALLEEIREINQGLIDTVLDVSDEDVDSTAAAAAAEGGEGTIVKCSFNAVALSPNLKSQYASAQMSPILPLRLLVPTNYPISSPILLDKFPAELSKDYDDLSVKARSRFNRSLRCLSQPMSLGDMVRTWDICARAIVADYAQQSGGGSFSSRYGTWENCVSAA